MDEGPIQRQGYKQGSRKVLVELVSHALEKMRKSFVLGLNSKVLAGRATGVPEASPLFS